MVLVAIMSEEEVLITYYQVLISQIKIDSKKHYTEMIYSSRWMTTK